MAYSIVLYQFQSGSLEQRDLDPIDPIKRHSEVIICRGRVRT